MQHQVEKRLKYTFVALVLAVALAAAGIFAIGANIDRYRPLAEKQLSAAIGRPVSAKRISLGWKGGLALAAKGVTIGDPSAPDVSADSVDAVVDVAALVSKKIIVKRLFVVTPVIRFKKTPAGLTVAGEAPAAAASSKGSSGEKPLLRVDLLRVEHGEVRWTDVSSAPPIEFVLRDVNVLVRNFDAAKGFDAEGSLAAFSEETGVHFRAAVDFSGSPAAGGVVRRFEAETDLGKLDLDELYKAAPELRKIGFREAPSGLVSLTVTDAPLEGFPGSSKAELVLKDGKIFVRPLPLPLEHAAMTATLDGRDIRLKTFSAMIAGGRVAAEGTLSDFTAADLSWTGRVSVQGLPVDAVLPVRPQGAPTLAGELSADFEGTARGTAWSRLSETLNGRGRLSLEKGTILNLNAARDVVQNLAKVPGIGDSIGAALSPATQARLREPHTALAPFIANFEARDRALILPGTQIDTNDFTLVLGGAVGLGDGGLNLQTRLFLSGELSATAARVVPEITSFLDANGRLEIPVRVSGTLRQPSFVADVKSIVTSIAASRGQQILTQLLRKKQDGAAQSTAAGAADPASYGKLLKNLF